MNKTYKTNKTDWRRRVILAAALLLGGMTAQAQQYVFLYKDGNTVSFLRNNSGTIQAQSDFGTYASTCIWTGSGTSSSTFINGNYGLYRYNNTLYSLSTDSYTPSTWTITTYGRVYNSNRYIRYYNSGWTSLNNTTSPGTGVAYTVLFTYSNHEAELTNPTISGADVLTATGTSNYSVAATTTPQYHQFDGYSGTTATKYYWYNSALQTSAPNTTNVTSGTWTLEGGGTNASVNASSGQITVSSLPATDLTMALKCTVTGNGITKTAQKTVVLYGSTIAAPTITRPSDKVTLATTSVNATIYYTTDGSTPSSSSTAYTGPFSIDNLTYPVTVKAIVIRNGNSSSVASETYNQPKCATPVISIASGGAVTITCATEGATIYYLKGDSNPADPTESTGTAGTSTTLTNLQYIKARAFKDGYDASEVDSSQYVTSGVNGGLVVLDDREDHTWAYYSSTDLPTMMRSLNPADVKITYYGNGTKTVSTTDGATPASNSWTENATDVQVNHDATANTFVYYKTLERLDGSRSNNPTGYCAYTTIPNPFQKRPLYGSGNDKWRGFYAWRIKDIKNGKIYTDSINGSLREKWTSGNVTTANTLYAGSTYYFQPDNEYGMEVELEALWARAYVVTTGNNNSNTSISSQDVGYERNFVVLAQNQAYRYGGNTNPRISNTGYAVTISRYYPDGTAGNTSATVRGGNDITLGADTKFENLAFSNMGSATLNAAGHDLIVGRGVTGTVNNLYGLNGSSSTSFNFRIESGTYNNLAFMGDGTGYGLTSGVMTAIMGCDYDRANNDNTTPRINTDIILCHNGTVGNSSEKGKEIFNCTVKSGNYDLGQSNYGGGNQFYISNWGDPTTYGKRTLTVEGGNFSDISGGCDDDGTTDVMMVDIKITGGTMNSAVYGAAQRSEGQGHRRMIITGGDFKGWIAGGANGNDISQTSYNGKLTGNTYLYVGGKARVDSDSSTSLINRSVGGNVFGAGCGYDDSHDIGYVIGNTNVAIADEAYIERGVYGGGSFGYCNTNYTSNIYIMGGTIDCIGGGVTSNGTGYTGNVKGGVYGGACQNKAGTNHVKVYGGTVKGGVYGGGNVTGDVAGPITVDIYGTDPAPSANAYAINQVFGGGNQAAFNGTPTVTVHCGADASTPISIEEVYGGGNQASVTGTNVTIEAGNIIGSVYGGGRQAAVGGNTSVTVNGGIIRRVFGGNNISGAISGTISVNVDKTSSCPMKIGQVFGGGNHAPSQVGSITVGCTGDLVTPLAGGQRYGYDQEGIGAVYGGANEANITGDITLNIVSGIVDSVFGGNNAGGDINGDITVNIAKNAKTCSWYVGYVFGGGNNAEYSQKTANHPAVNVSAGLVTHHVFGGGNGEGAVVYGNPTVTLSGTAQVGGNVFGGGNAAAVDGNTSVKLQN